MCLLQPELTSCWVSILLSMGGGGNYSYRSGQVCLKYSDNIRIILSLDIFILYFSVVLKALRILWKIVIEVEVNKTFTWWGPNWQVDIWMVPELLTTTCLFSSKKKIIARKTFASYLFGTGGRKQLSLSMLASGVLFRSLITRTALITITQ